MHVQTIADYRLADHVSLQIFLLFLLKALQVFQNSGTRIFDILVGHLQGLLELREISKVRHAVEWDLIPVTGSP